jgi:hypothetical protein
MCRKDTPEVLDARGRPLTYEHAGLGLERTPCKENPLHCEDCLHVVRPPRLGLAVAGAVLLVAGRFLQQNLPEAGLVVSLAGVVVLVAGIALAVERWRRVRMDRPWLPWVPKLRRLDVVETVAGTLDLDPTGAYRTEVASAEGVVSVEATFGEVERLVYQCFARRFRLAESEKISFRAGFLLLAGQAGLTFEPDASVAAQCPNVLVLEGQTSEEPAQQAIRGTGLGEWMREWRYRIEVPDDRERELPLCIVPYVQPESGGRRMKLEVRWNEVDGRSRHRRWARPPRLKAVMIEELEVHFPPSWGEIHAIGDRVVTTIDAAGADGPRRRVVWRKVLVRPEEARDSCRCFEIQFENSVELSARLDGRVTVELREGASGVERALCFYASGLPTGQSAPASTRLVATFSLALDSLRHREVRVVPDAKREQEQALLLPHAFEGVVPDHTTVLALGRALVQHGCYLKSVVEDRPRTGASPHLVSRLWDLSGRLNERIHPVEFHISLSGEAEVAGGALGTRGTTNVTLTVHGSFSDQRQEDEVRTSWDGLRQVIETTLTSRAQRQRPLASPAAPPADPPPPRAPVYPRPVVTAPPQAPGGDLARLRELLLAGHISEHTYREMRIELERSAEQDGRAANRRAEVER